MNFEIKNRFTEEVQFSCELPQEMESRTYGEQLGYAVKKAIEEQAYLVGAYLVGANLTDAYLREANLEGAILLEANLYGANLIGANLIGVTFDRAKSLEDIITINGIKYKKMEG